MNERRYLCLSPIPGGVSISWASLTTNISKLHTAGADLVMPYASMAANMIVNFLKPGELVMLAEGLNVFRVEPRSSMVGKSLAETHIGRETGCNVIAVYDAGKMIINPDPSFRFVKDNELIMIGTTEAEQFQYRSLNPVLVTESIRRLLKS